MSVSGSKTPVFLLQEQRKDVILSLSIKEVEAARPGSYVDMPEKVLRKSSTY